MYEEYSVSSLELQCLLFEHRMNDDDNVCLQLL